MKELLDKYFTFVKDFLPEKEINSSVGIDIGERSCKIVEMVRAEESFKILNWGVEPIVANDLPGTIKNIFTKYELTSKSPYMAVFGKGTLIRYIDMPRMSIDDLKKSFDLESDKYFPFPSDQIYTDCYILDPKGQEKKMSVLVAAAKKEIIDARIKLFVDAGVQSNFIGINPIAIANVFNALGKGNQRKAPAGPEDVKSSVVAVLDMGETVSNLIILQDNLPRFTRDIYVGGQEFNKRISNTLGLDIAEAEKLKHQPGAKKEEILSACDSILMNLVSEIRLSFDYFITERNVQISKLLLTGGASALHGAQEFFSKSLDVPAERWNPLDAFVLGEKVVPEEIQQNIHRLGVALGLALYQYD